MSLVRLKSTVRTQAARIIHIEAHQQEGAPSGNQPGGLSSHSYEMVAVCVARGCAGPLLLG
jgi:hypothetical protein